jgi:vancomycin resistance protein YoaR
MTGPKNKNILQALKKEDTGRRHAPAVPRGVLLTLICLLVVSAVIIGAVFAVTAAYADSVFPGTSIGDIKLGGLAPARAQELLQERANTLIDEGLSFTYQGITFNIPSTVEDPANPELSHQVFSVDASQTIANLMATQQKRNEAERIFYWLVGWSPQVTWQLNEDSFQELFNEDVSQYQQPAVNAGLVIGVDGAMSVTAEKSGQIFKYGTIVGQIGQNVNNLTSQAIPLTLETDTPGITRAQAEPLLDMARQVLTAAPFTLRYSDRTWELSKDNVQKWLGFQVGNPAATVGLEQDSLAHFLEGIAQEVNVGMQEGKFVMANGKVQEFKPSQKGLELQIAASAAAINDKIKQVGITDIDLVVNETDPTVQTGDVNDLGINELIGVGHSNFKGSPKNRRHNIEVGANKLNGILIKPGEEFSLVKTLGAIDASTGYLTELVIKGNKTVPEYGGGLCQIGTTTFRAALDAGLPILERKNHSYRVSYYEPAGTDATIYDPKPDFRFLNDTGHYILFTTEMTGDDLYFRFYGTKDGRTVAQTTPRVFNQVRPGAAKLIETTDLKPGVKKCTEKAHTGADTEFTRTVVYPSGEKKVDVFKSHYKPWQEVCLIGVAKLSEPATQ